MLFISVKTGIEVNAVYQFTQFGDKFLISKQLTFVTGKYGNVIINETHNEKKHVQLQAFKQNVLQHTLACKTAWKQHASICKTNAEQFYYYILVYLT